MTKTLIRHLTLFAFLFAFAPTALSHATSDAFIHLNVSSSRIDATLEVSVLDLEWDLHLDDNSDDLVTWGELNSKPLELQRFIASGLNLSSKGQSCSIGISTLQVVRHSDGLYAHIPLQTTCPQEIGEDLQLEYNLIFERDANHRVFVSTQQGDAREAGILSPDRRIFLLRIGSATNSDSSSHFWSFLREGILHILSGLDHLCFLVLLLIGTVFGEVKAPKKSVIVQIIRLVTSFSIAHSITLLIVSYRVFGTPNTKITEALIACSVIVVAVDNLFRMSRHTTVVTVFVMGLIHGTGFGSSLIDLGLSGWTLLKSLVAFNIGIEVAQVLLVFLSLPILFSAKSSQFFGPLIQKGGSIACMFSGIYWLMSQII